MPERRTKRSKQKSTQEIVPKDTAYLRCMIIMDKIIRGKHSTNKELHSLLVDAAKEFANMVLESEGQEEYDKLFK